MKRTMALAAIAILVLSGAAYGAGADISFRLAGGATWARYFQSRGEAGIPEFYFLPDDRVGPAAGMGYEIAFPFSRSLTLLGSVDYIQKGSRVEPLFHTMNLYSKVGFTYSAFKFEALSLTQLIKIKPFQDLFPYALAGFELSHVLSHSYVMPPSNLKTSVTDDTRKTDFGLVAGAGGELVSGRWASFLEVRYHLGLANLSKGTGIFINYPNIKTRALNLFVGIRYKLGKKA
jgi:opacity protein-like surface antigen